jgi:hypothetical protein
LIFDASNVKRSERKSLSLSYYLPTENMVDKSVNNNDDDNYESLACGIERIKKNSKYLSNREKQQMDEIYYMLRYMLKEKV